MSGKAWPSYSFVAGWTIFIYLTVPFVRPFQKFVYSTVGKRAFGYFVLVALTGGLIWGLCYLRRKRVGIANYLWLAGIGVAYAYFTGKLWRIPEEAVHFVEYGFLSFLVYLALRHHVRNLTIYFSSASIVLFLGTVDEIIQWLVPGRFWEFRDVWLNSLSGSLLQLALWKGVRPPEIVEKVNIRSFRTMSLAMSASVLLLGLCFSLIPPRIEYISGKLRFHSFLRENENMMSETGFRHVVPGLAVFFSRFTMERLAQMDEQHQAVYAEILNDNVNMNYDEFLKIYSPVSFPFLYEMRIHLFRRDRYFDRGRRVEVGGQRTEFWSVAYGENTILENYFGKTLRKSVYKWSEVRKWKVAKVIQRDELYESPVSKQLFTRFTEREVWLGIGTLLGVLFLANVYASRRAGKGKVFLVSFCF